MNAGDKDGLFSGFYAILNLVHSTSEEQALVQASQLLAGGAKALQLRMKGASADAMMKIAYPVGALVRSYGIPFIINDRITILNIYIAV